MKKLFIAALLLGGIATAQAQTGQGTVMLGGGIGFESEKTNDGRNDDDEKPGTTFYFNPQVGYFLADKLALGLQLGIEKTSYNVIVDDQYEGSTTAFRIGPFIRYYMPTASENFSFYVQGGFGYGTAKFNPEDDDLDRMFEDPITTVDLGISPGFSFFPTQKIGIDFQIRGLQYTSSSYGEGDDKVSRNNFVLGTRSLTPSLGINFFF